MPAVIRGIAALEVLAEKAPGSGYQVEQLEAAKELRELLANLMPVASNAKSPIKFRQLAAVRAN